MVNNFSFGNAFSYFFRYQRRADGSSFRGNFLTFWRVEIFQVGFRHLCAFFSTTLSTTDTVGSARIDSPRRDDFEFIFPQFIRCQQNFVFPSDQYIANPALDRC